MSEIYLHFFDLYLTKSSISSLLFLSNKFRKCVVNYAPQNNCIATGLFPWYDHKIFQKTNISYPLIRTGTRDKKC